MRYFCRPMDQPTIILAIESSCDDTSAAVIKDGVILSNLIATQKIHESFGGVVPEMASRAHLQHIVPVVTTALDQAGVSKDMLFCHSLYPGPGITGQPYRRDELLQGPGSKPEHPLYYGPPYAGTYPGTLGRGP